MHTRFSNLRTYVHNHSTYPWRVFLHSWSDYRQLRPLVSAIIADLRQCLTNRARLIPASTAQSCNGTCDMTPCTLHDCHVMILSAQHDDHVTVM